MVRSFAAALLLSLLASAAWAEEPDILTRLRNEPLTLFDWGLAQLDRDMQRAAARLVAGEPGGEPPRTSVVYSWRERRVLLTLAAEVPERRRTEAECTTLFHLAVQELTVGAPQGPYAAGWYLHHAFQPKGHFWASRFEDIGAKLLDAVRLEVALRAPTHRALAGDRRQVRCRGRLDAEPDAIAVELQG